MTKKVYVGINNIARNVNKIYVGVNNVAKQVKKAYVGINGIAKQFYQKPLEYLESTGTQYINTGIVPKSTTRMILEFAVDDTTIENICGWASGGGNEIFICGSNPTNFICGCSHNFNVVNTNVPPDYAKHTFDISNSGLYFDNELYGTGTIGNTAGSLQTLYLFAQDIEWQPYVSYAKIKIYSCKLYENTTLVRNFIPVLDTNNTPCLYDKVTSTYFYNQGTGTFLYN